MAEVKIIDENVEWCDSTKIEFACETADKIIEWIDEYGSIDLFVKDEKGDIIYAEDDKEGDVSGLTELGRDLFEFIYDLVRFD